MNSFDIAVFILLAIGAITGCQKGLLTGLSRLIGKLAAIGIALFFHKEFLGFVEPLFNLREKIEPQINSLLVKVFESQSAVGSGELTQPVIGEATGLLTDYALKIMALIALFLIAIIVINIIISLIIKPLAKSLGIVNRGGGLAFGLLSTFIVLSIVIGLAAPILTTMSAAGIDTGNSVSYPYFVDSFNLIKDIFSIFAGDILTNPLELLPQLPGTAV